MNKIILLVQLQQLLAEGIYICCMLSSSKSLLGFNNVCLNIVYISLWLSQRCICTFEPEFEPRVGIQSLCVTGDTVLKTEMYSGGMHTFDLQIFSHPRLTHVTGERIYEINQSEINQHRVSVEVV